MTMVRYASIRLADEDEAGIEAQVQRIEAYLPDNYKVIGVAEEAGVAGTTVPYAVLAGRDSAGWTLDGYVIPRLGTGLISVVEIDLSHPLLKKIPDDRPITVPRTAVKLTLGYSEVCMHMKVAGTEMWVDPVGDLMAQLYTLNGQKFSIPIGRGEAGLPYPPKETS